MPIVEYLAARDEVLRDEQLAGERLRRWRGCTCAGGRWELPPRCRRAFERFDGELGGEPLRESCFLRGIAERDALDEGEAHGLGADEIQKLSIATRDRYEKVNGRAARVRELRVVDMMSMNHNKAESCSGLLVLTGFETCTLRRVV